MKKPMQISNRSMTAALCCLLLIITSSARLSAAPGSVATPDVSPIPAIGTMWNQAPVDLRAHGLQEAEFYFSGETADGTYKSRMIVRRPINPRRFNGTVIVEWMNASSGLDIDVDFLSLLPLIKREGYAYVAITAQQVSASFLNNYSPERYGTLTINEASRFDVFAQAGKALLENGNGVDPLQGLKARRLIAIGQSQSSSQLTQFIDTIHGLEQEPVYDAFIPHAGANPAGTGVNAPSRFPVPVFKINSESEAPGYFGSRDTADPNYVYWEVAGTAHQPLEGTEYANALLAEGRGAPVSCPFPFEGVGGPTPIDPVLRAAVHHLHLWLRFGIKPPSAPLIAMQANPANPSQGIIQRDQYGNALGGIRLPQQEVPVARNTPSYGCVIQVPFPPFSITLDLFPQYDAFDGNNDPAIDPTDIYLEPNSAKELYGNHGRYVRKFSRATVDALFNGHILWFDAVDMIKTAARSDVAR